MPGTLWVCGKHAVGPDPSTALARVDATTIVCLTERHELADRYPDYVDWLAEHLDERAVWSPIADLHAPPLAVVLPLLTDLADRLQRGERLLMHCGAGIGRAGTIAACLLMKLGTAERNALGIVRASRPAAGPEVGAQRELIGEMTASFAQDSPRTD